MTLEDAARLDPDEQPGELEHGRWRVRQLGQPELRADEPQRLGRPLHRGRGPPADSRARPEVAIEVCGDDQAPGELAKKALEFVAAGSRAVWVVEVAGEDVLDAGDALTGFPRRVAEVFAQLTSRRPPPSACAARMPGSRPTGRWRRCPSDSR